MPPEATRKRTQFTSCDACRQSRVACDARRRGYDPEKTGWRGSCSRCSRKRRPCTFEWIKSSTLRSQESQDPSPATSIERSNTHEAIERPDIANGNDATQLSEPISAWLKQSCNVIFEQGFDGIFGLLVGKYGCPLVDGPSSKTVVSAIELACQLDAYLKEEPYLRGQGCPLSTKRIAQDDVEIEHSFRCIVRMFAHHWIPSVFVKNMPATIDADRLIEDTWRIARAATLKVINRPSYRSILALYLFSRLPIPSTISEDEELDGISGLVCLQTALLHIQQLRGRQKNRMSGSAPPAYLTKAFLDLENRAYWAAIVWDTSNALMSNLRTSLTSGLRGACGEPAWRLTSGFLKGSFQPKAEQWLHDGIDITDETASEIIAAAGVSKVYIWKNIASLTEAIREGVDEETVLFVWSNVLDAIAIYKTSARPLLNACERKLHFLGQINRLNWYHLSLHYHLGILILVEALEGAARTDLLQVIREHIEDSEQESFNVLKFGLENDYRLQEFMQAPTTGQLDSETSIDPAPREVMVSLLSIDPNPHYVADIVLLMGNTIGRKYREGQINGATSSYLYSILCTALEKLPQGSKYVQNALQRLKEISHNT